MELRYVFGTVNLNFNVQKKTSKTNKNISVLHTIPGPSQCDLRLESRTPKNIK